MKAVIEMQGICVKTCLVSRKAFTCCHKASVSIVAQTLLYTQSRWLTAVTS